MSKSLNKVHLIGHTGSEPEIRTTAGGTMVAKVGLATNQQRKGKNGVVTEQTNWHRLTFFGRLAEIVEHYVGKGDRLYVEGRIEYDNYEKDDGSKVFTTEIVVNELVMLGSLDSERGAVPAGDASDDLLPF